MSEQKGKLRKTMHIVEQILKWLWVVLLSALLLLALVFQAPWKVTILLLVFLLACTALPKAYRKWFWLATGITVLALIIWVLLPGGNESWRAYTFDEESAKYHAEYMIPGQGNAAQIYDKLLSYDMLYFIPDSNDPNVYNSTQLQLWSNEDYPQIAQWLNGKEEMTSMLLDASRIEKCRFPPWLESVNYEQHLYVLYPMFYAAKLTISSANNDIAENRINQGLNKYIAVLQMANHLYQQPLKRDLQIGLDIEKLAARQINIYAVTSDADETQLEIIEDALKNNKHRWNYDLSKIIEYEKLMLKNMLCKPLYDINRQGKVRLSRNPFSVQNTKFTKEDLSEPYWQRKVIKTGPIVFWFFLPATPRNASQIIEAEFERIASMASPDYDWQNKPAEFAIPSLLTIRAHLDYRHLINLWTDMAEGVYYKLHNLHLRAIAEQRGSRLLIALRRYKNKQGQWPTNLNDIKPLIDKEILIDPINGGEFVYKLTDDGFRLYSRGKSNIDDIARDPAPDSDDIFIWPQSP